MTPQQFLELLERQGDAMERHEETVTAAATAPMRAAFSQLVKDVAKRWAVLHDAVEAGDTRALTVFTALFGSLRDAVPDLRPAARDSLELGARQAVEADDDIDDVDLDDDLPQDIEDMLDDLDQAVEDKLDKAEALLYAQSVNKDRMDTAVAIAGRSVNSVEITASQVAVRGVAEGQRAAAKQAKRRMIWRAERDACLICLAYSGLVSDLNGTFPAGRTFDKKPRKRTRDKVKPPEHPHCRCTATVYNPRNDPGGLISSSLQREARRSVVKGWGLPTESDAARRRAAENLLKLGAELPKTVEAEARRRLRTRRKFRRAVPS